MALDLCWDRLDGMDAVNVNENVICTTGSLDKTLDNGSALISKKNELIGIAACFDCYPRVFYRIHSQLAWIESVCQRELAN